MTAERTGARDVETMIDLLWRTRPPGSRGPRGALSLDRIVETAMEIADADGVGGVSMRKIAERLDVTTMSLYRYIPRKEDLLDLMFDAVMGKPDTGAWPEDWRGRLTCYALDARATMLARPWLCDIPLSGPPLGPNNLSWLEAALASLDGTGLSDGDMVGLIMILTNYVLSDVRQVVSINRAVPRTGFTYEEWGEIYGRTLATRIDPARFPHVVRVATSGVFGPEAASGDEDFMYGVDFLLDGVEALVRRGDAPD
ncbi:TetR/AcrR family transcriptional regulator [Streptomyces marincola]|uniref:TetR/AcrR family transcriptional regulator n=1 Tax=Streptomyces marincola TaxID=2878388 RepID=UPI001CF4321C|nr:TetR/AcrR family transcriptional regulator [Streptomyces marincola]UCM88426.1 TetR/AcrR family transcriptional regulator [Streptomyces marincola]